jgi:hypothetical protein
MTRESSFYFFFSLKKSFTSSLFFLLCFFHWFVPVIARPSTSDRLPQSSRVFGSALPPPPTRPPARPTAPNQTIPRGDIAA